MNGCAHSFVPICLSGMICIHRESVLVSYCCCNKLPQTLWLKNTNTVIILQPYISEVQNESCWAKSQGVSRPAFLLEVLGQNLFPCLFQLLECAHIPWLVASLHLQSQQSHHSDLCFHCSHIL